jgi:LAO/AO transport system kinase
MLQERLLGRLKSDAAVRARLPAIESAVAEGRLTATLAVEKLAAILKV